MSRRPYSRRQGQFSEVESKDNSVIEISGEAPGGFKGGVKAPHQYVHVLVLCVIAAALTILALVLRDHASESNMTAKQVIHSVQAMTEAIRMQACIATLPQDERRNEFMNPNSRCNFLAKER